MTDEVVYEMCAVLDRSELDLNAALAAAGAIVEMLLTKGVEPQHRLEAAERFYGVVCKRIRTTIN